MQHFTDHNANARTRARLHWANTRLDAWLARRGIYSRRELSAKCELDAAFADDFDRAAELILRCFE